MENQLFFSTLMLSAGIGIPIMAALSSAVGTRHQSPAFAASVLFLVAFVISVTYLFALQGGIKQIQNSPLPFYFYFGGALVAFYVLSVTWTVPYFGIGNALAFVLLGQIISMAVIDQFGLMRAPMHAITMQRLIGIVMMSIGVFLAVRRD